MRGSKFSFLCVLVAVFALALCVSSAWATTYNVANEAQLRNAIAAVNDDDVINFTANITLTTAALTIPDNKRFTIEGNNKTLKQQIPYTYGVIRHEGGSTALTINKLTITGGASAKGGGIYFKHPIVGGFGSTLRLNDCKITSNDAYDGGGIHFDGDNLSGAYAILTDCEVSNNRTHSGVDGTGNGGGIYYSGNKGITLLSSAVHDNQATNNGGGIYLTGGPYAWVEVIVSTVANNTASGQGGGMFTSTGEFYIVGSTITGNHAPASGGGGINVEGTSKLYLLASIITGNTDGGTASDITVTTPHAQSAGFNVFGKTTDHGGWVEIPATDSLNVAALDVFGTNTLTNNGGPTQTVALVALPTNPAVNKIPDGTVVSFDAYSAVGFGNATNPFPPASEDVVWNVISADQRDFPRPGEYKPANQQHVDAGAFEAQSVSVSLLVRNENELRNAVLAASNDAVIQFANNITINNSALTIPNGQNFIIDGKGWTLTKGGTNDSVITHTGGSATNIAIKNLTITGGNVSSNTMNGGGIYWNNTSTGSKLSVENSTISGNEAKNGGGIAVEAGEVDIINSTIRDNTATDAGGGGWAVSNNGDVNITVKNSTISTNSADHGGGLYAASTAVAINTLSTTIVNSTIHGNAATGTNGGGVYIMGAVGNAATSDIAFCTITANTAANGVGGGLNVGSYATIQPMGNIAVGNTASGGATNGPDIYFWANSTGTSLGYNVIGDVGSGGGGMPPGTGDIINSIHGGVGKSNVFGGTGTPVLQNNGGLTETVALPAGSIAIGRVANSAIGGLSDQRGLPRPGTGKASNANADSGAFETQTSFIPVASVSLNQTTATLSSGVTLQLVATVLPANATNKAVTWSSNNLGVATVTNGVVSAVGVGTATVTVTTADQGKTANCVVTVTAAPINVTSVDVTPATASIAVGYTRQLAAAITPSNATNQTVTWVSGTPGIATISATGLVTAVAQGSATITATTTDGGYTDSCAVTVTLPATGVTLNKSSTTIIGIGNTETLNATVAPIGANTNVTWGSSNNSVATVATNGTVTANAAGTATITATTADGGFTATCAVTVTVPVTGVTLNKNSTSLAVRDKETLTVTVAPTGATNKAVTWSTSDAGIATVSGGIVEGIASGDAVITVTTTDGSNLTDTCTVTVRSVAVTGVTLDKSTIFIVVGNTDTLSATVLPANATIKTVTWESSDEAIAKVSGGTVTGVGIGSADITVTTTDGGHTATCRVTITPGKPAKPKFSTEMLTLYPGGSGSIYADINGTWTIGDPTILTGQMTPFSIGPSNVIYVSALKLGQTTLTFTSVLGGVYVIPVYVQTNSVVSMDDGLKPSGVTVHILSPDVFLSVDARVEPTPPTMLCYAESGKPAGVVSVNISDTTLFPDTSNVFLPMQYTLRLTEAELKAMGSTVKRNVDTSKFFSQDGPLNAEAVREFFSVFVIQKEILQGARTGQLARLLGAGREEILTPQRAIADGSLTMTADTADRIVQLQFRYLVKDGDYSPYYDERLKELVIGDGLADRMIVDPLWASMRKLTDRERSGGIDGGSGCATASSVGALWWLLIGVIPLMVRRRK